MLRKVEEAIRSQPNRAKYALNEFEIAVAIYFLPLHEEAVKTARRIGKAKVDRGNASCKTPVAWMQFAKGESRKAVLATQKQPALGGVPNENRCLHRISGTD